MYADPDKVEQVLTNLVENACKYASAARACRSSACIDEGEVCVTVTDTGEGIPEDDLPKVFTKFFRRDMGKPTGSGLGLWISRGLVEAHGGRLSASSKPGEGTAFRFTLPLVEFEELHSEQDRRRPDGSRRRSRRRSGPRACSASRGAATLDELRAVEAELLGQDARAGDRAAVDRRARSRRRGAKRAG